MKIYETEKKLGLGDKITEASVASCAMGTHKPTFAPPDELIQQVKKSFRGDHEAMPIIHGKVSLDEIKKLNDWFKENSHLESSAYNTPGYKAWEGRGGVQGKEWVSKVLQEQTQAEKLFPYMDSEDIDFEKKYLSPDLMSIWGILVSTTWNKNDDVFTPEDTYNAAYTPIFKPANLMHVGREEAGDNQTIGVIYSSQLVDEKYDSIYEIPMDEEGNAEKFHILVGMYLWEHYFPTAVGNIKERVDSGEMFISMECVFQDFGYALRRLNSEEILLLPRNELTSWLSAHLRILGGTGQTVINGSSYQVGRWIVDPVFSGVGFVDQPANPESILFEDYLSHNSAAAALKFKPIEESEMGKFENNKENSVSHTEGKIALWQ